MIRIPAIALPVVSIMDAVPDILCRGTAIRDVNVECLGGRSQWLIVRHAGIPDCYHCSIAGRRVGLAPADATDTTFGVDVGFLVNAVQRVRAVYHWKLSTVQIGTGHPSGSFASPQ